MVVDGSGKGRPLESGGHGLASCHPLYMNVIVGKALCLSESWLSHPPYGLIIPVKFLAQLLAHRSFSKWKLLLLLFIINTGQYSILHNMKSTEIQKLISGCIFSMLVSFFLNGFLRERKRARET